MRFRSSALVLLGALALLLASAGVHRHEDRGPELDKPCTVCAVLSQSTAISASPATLPRPAQQFAFELQQRAPLARAHRRYGSAAPRGPPLTA
jgi:hypothetical protein